MKFRKLIWLSLIICIFAGLRSEAAMTVDEVRSVLLNQNLSVEEADKVIGALKETFGDESGEEMIAISGVIYSRGFNFGLIFDSDNWYMDATFISPETNQLVGVNDLFKVRFKNGGIKFDLSYKWMFIFVPSGVDIRTLDRSVYGRGVGVTLNVAFGVDAAWMPGKNSPGSLFLIAPKVGLGGGLTFPKMTFEFNEPL